MSDNQLAVEVVRGEMQPWSDYTGKRGAVQGPALRALLTDVLPDGARTLILGPHGADLVDAVVAKASETTLLVRSVSDAGELGEKFGAGLQVVAGALDGLADDGRPQYDVVVAADGLDRVLGYDSADLNWTQRLDALAAVAAPGAVLVLGLENEFSLTNLLDSRPADQRHGDDEWRPLHDDPTRPVSVDQLLAELDRVGLSGGSAYAAYAVGETQHALISADVAAAARPGHLPTRLAVEALEAAATVVPLLAPVAEGAESAARAGLLAATPTGWIAVTGTNPKHAIYTRTTGHPAVLTGDASNDGWSVAVAAQEDADSVEGLLVFDPSAVPSTVPGGVTAETLLFRLAAAENVPAFRDLAARLGDWARSQTGSRVLPRWDDVVVDGDSFAFGVSAWATVGEESEQDRLAAAWARFHDRLISTHRRHPWPPWMVGDDLVSAWLAMSGIEPVKQTPATAADTPSASTAQIARGRELADALATALGVPAEAPQTPDVRTALADAERAAQEVFELKGQIFGLERTLGFRDKALKTRETRLREMRTQVQKANLERTKLRNSRAYSAVKLIRGAAQIRNPRKLAGKVKRRVKSQLREKLG
ncbi:hypothetical protein Kfla_0508 [Kribbella flavida DSM 17836]|uniref:Class I SAM-dependent methyltransferase n=1 Tax=Kribbella flavida (strain DSM 17836 / JCM 10339 / NBRC 14399) TaxID=479435 RepID=D2PVX3_KRIFD|nr:hypothetical protein [Kribbella flavida]ADB29630.1 hypothetical protein Kfla_0508 [Kribbella flavida DSM 17836]